jgi:GT2 family glycosyltransferase
MTREGRPLVSVIVPSWNARDLLTECLAALERLTYEPLEIIVVDDGSTDGSAEMITSQWGDRVRLVRNETNMGFAPAVNRGVRAARGAFIAVLNNDALPEPGWITALVEAAGRQPRTGMVASKILNLREPRILDGVGLLLYPDGSSRAQGRLEVDQGQYDSNEEALLPSGCAAFYRRAMLDEIGLYDESFCMCCEDTDLGLRARLAGWRCAFTPKAVVHHHYSATMGEYSERKAYLVERNRLWLVAKNFPLGRLLLSPLYTLQRYLLQAWGALSGRGAAGQFARRISLGRLLLTLIRAQVAGLRGLPRALRARREIMVRVPPSEIDRWFREFGIGARELSLKE